MARKVNFAGGIGVGRYAVGDGQFEFVEFVDHGPKLQKDTHVYKSYIKPQNQHTTASQSNLQVQKLSTHKSQRVIEHI